MDKDFSRIQFKVNVAGSWANLVNVPADRYDEVKAACVTLANAHRGSIRFKALDAEGGVIEEYSYVQNGHHGLCWHEPRVRR